jgi:hypothetical protein
MKHAISILALALLSSACASPQFKREPAWSKAPEAAATQAKAGHYHASMDRMMQVAQYMFETEGLLWGRRDDDAKSFMSEVIKEAGSDDENLLELKFTQEEGGVVSAKWTHYKIIKYKNVDQCLDKEGKPDTACQSALDEDWNWRLYKQLR